MVTLLLSHYLPIVVGIQPKESNVPIHLLEEAVWDKVFDVNIKSVFWMCK